ncbi:MAG: GGDEF domain-containing protein [Alphaproteobacteria bacterium]|nr:GGDEF domain-containing protein [Alphaproteobacteria bacterium]
MDSYEIDADYERSLGRRRIKYRIAYISSLLAIAIVSIVSFYLVSQINLAQKTIASNANMNAEQKVLSQRIHRLAENFVETPDSEHPLLIKSLSAHIKKMQENHQALTQGNPELGLPGDHSEKVNALLFSKGTGLDDMIQRFTTNAVNIIETPSEFRTLDNPNLVALRVATSSTLLDGLDAILTQQKLELGKQIEKGRNQLIILLVVVLSTLAATGVFIFNPLYKKIIEQNQVLFELALTDPLTGCQNRRSFMEFASKEFDRVVRHGNSTCVISIDIDTFKTVNDTYGHPVGDEVIRNLVRTCLTAIRSSDHLGRLGGEEFAIVLIETDVQNAVSVAEKIRSAFEAVETTTKQGPIKCTASFGVTKIEKADDGIQGTLERADEYLYMAKKSGRNKVVGPQEANA